MKTDLIPLSCGVNRLSLKDVSLIDIDNVDSWLYAIDLPPCERKAACLQVLTRGNYSVCNIEYRIEVCIKGVSRRCLSSRL